ncbi:MAG: tetratricopeptide repeat protein [Polyangiaceae bacterium]
MAKDDDEIDQDAVTRKPPSVAEGAREDEADDDGLEGDDDGLEGDDDGPEGDDDAPDGEGTDDDPVDDEAETTKPPSVRDRGAERAAARAEVRRERPARALAADDDGDPDAGELDEPDEGQAARIADALGVGEGEGVSEPTSPAVEEAVAQNRAARRRDEARDRRRKRRDGAKDAAITKAAAVAGDDLPRDRNARAKEVLLRRREQAAGGSRAVSSALLPSEMVDDALARSASAAGKWFRGNWNIIQWVILAGVVVGGGFMFWSHRAEKSSGEASGFLGQALAAESGAVTADDKRPDEEKAIDDTRVFKTAEEREAAAMAAYQKVVEAHGNSGPGILAKLGLAGVQLDKRDWDPALSGFEAVLATTLAGADPDVKGRALEGVGLAKEGKGDLDGALEAYKKVEGVEAKGFKELGLYHQARIHIAKGDKDKAKELLKAAQEKLNAPGIDGKPFQQLQAMVETTLRDLDPTAVPTRPNNISGPKGTQMTPDELEKLIKRAREASEKKAPEGGDPHGDH